MMVPNFKHRHAGHCESGVTSSLLTHYGLPLSEPMALGLSASMTFVHLPFVKIGGFPLTAYRMLPGSIYKGLRGALGLKMHAQRFSGEDEAMAALDAQLAAGRPVGLQTSVFWLPYFPPDMRFHFNAHNMIVYGKNGDNYLVSDPVFDQPQRCPAKDLRKARFTQGAFAPKGLMYYPEQFDKNFDLDKAVRRAIKKTWRMMLYTPVPFVGVGAIRRLAGSIEKLPQKHPDPRYARLYVGNIVRMQEEIGTGGGGFRFMYAAFLQEAGKKLNNDLLLDAAGRMTAAGDGWREFALMGAQFGRKKDGVDCKSLAERLRQCAGQEEAVYRLLKTL
ncbi:MAG: BtrH N-terminal domain-containing protein [Stenotrophobium sp.]